VSSSVPLTSAVQPRARCGKGGDRRLQPLVSLRVPEFVPCGPMPWPVSLRPARAQIRIRALSAAAASPGTRWAAALPRQNVLPRGPTARPCNRRSMSAGRPRAHGGPSAGTPLRTPASMPTAPQRDRQRIDPDASSRQPHRLDLQDPIAFRIPSLPARLTFPHHPRPRCVSGRRPSGACGC
jgi:hypothetical protein